MATVASGRPSVMVAVVNGETSTPAPSSVDLIFDLLIAYSDTLEAEREYIENHATEGQIWQAFQEVLRLSDFLGISSMFGRRIGLTMSATSSKSLAQNTDTE